MRNICQLKRILYKYIPFQIPIDKTRTIFGCKFNSGNHLVKTLEELDEGILSYAESSLYKFHKEFLPQSIFDLIDGIQNERKNVLIKRFPQGEYPWGYWSKKGKDWRTSRFCGPTEDIYIQEEWERFKSLLQKVKREGFRYGPYGYPAGVLLENKNKDKRFVVLQGNHRIAIARYLGIRDLKVRFIAKNRINPIVTFSELNQWSAVLDKTIEKDEAENLLEFFFK